jgi:hypothetical protein
VELPVQAEKLPDSKLSAEIVSDAMDGGVGVRTLTGVGVALAEGAAFAVADGGILVPDTRVAVGEIAATPVDVEVAVGDDAGSPVAV